MTVPDTVRKHILTMWSKLKQNVKRRLESHIREEIDLASRDILLARRHKATVDSASFVDQFMPMARAYTDRFDLLRAAVKEVTVAGLCCEFGVYNGESINFLASLLPQEIHGFDSFEGLPEDWNFNHPKGKFALARLPEVRSNVRLHPGWFESSIPTFRQEHSAPIAFLHLDADLYSSTRTVLELMGDQIVAGTVIQFDELLNYPEWQGGEHKAFTEFCEARRVEARYFGYVPTGGQVAAKVIHIAPLKA